MSPEGTPNNHEQENPSVSVESVGEKLKEYQKAMRAVFFVAALGVGAGNQKAEAEDNAVTGGLAQESITQAAEPGVTEGAEREGEVDAPAKRRVVTPRSGRNWIIPPEYKKVHESVSENVSIGRVTVDGKEITEDR